MTGLPSPGTPRPVDVSASRDASTQIAPSEFLKVFRTSPVPMAITRARDGWYLDVNDAFCHATGWAREEVLARTSLDIRWWVTPEEREAIRRRLLAEGAVQDLDIRFRARSGDVRQLLLSSTVVQLGDAACFLSSFQDVTDLRRAEAEAQALAAIERELLAELDRDRLLQLIVDRAGKLTEADGAIYLLVRDWLVPTARTDVGTHPRPIAVGEGVSGECARSGQGLVVNHYAAWAGALPDFQALAVSRVMSQPLRIADDLIGVITMSRRGGDAPAFRPEDHAVLARFAGQAALALRNATLYEAVEERRREAESLAELGRAVASLDPRHVLDTIAARIPDLAGTPGGAVALVLDDGRVRFAASRGLPAEFASFEPRHPRDGVTASAISERRPVWSADVLNDPAVALSPPSRDFIETHGRRAVLAVPIIGGERALGALVAVRSEAGPFTPEQVRRLEAAAAHAAVAIENARLYEEAETRRHEAEIVARITRSVGASLDLDRILQQVAEGARELCRSDMARIALLEAGSEGMTFRYWVGARYPGYAGVRVEAGQGVGGRVMVTGQPFRTDDWVRDPRISKETLHVVQAEGVVAMVAVPIRIAQRIEGLLYVENRSPRPFAERDEVVLTQLADQAALALHNARLFAGEQEARKVAERSEERFREGEALFRGAFEGAATGMVLQAPDGRYLRANRVFCEMIGHTEAELRTRTWQELTHPADLSTEPNERLLRREVSSYTLEKRYRHRDGHDVWALVGVALVRDGQGGPLYFVVQVQDITERKHSAAVRERLEGELRQAQKMEAIGRLSGGIAHDFNNLLAVIMGHSELLASRLAPADPAQQDAEMIRRASERAAELTRQLLAFSRRQPQEPRVLDLNALVTSLLSMLQRLIGADVQLVTRLAPDLGRVRADPGQIEQVLMNLVVNARDSMPQGGRLTLTTDNVLLGARGGDLSLVGPAVQAHVRLGVEDTGIGMSEETQAHVFEPFFTTKGPDKGTGLGLSTAYGIVSQHQGRIEVRSGLGQGTTFWVYLPRIEEPLSAPVAPTTRAHLPGGAETILVVEDEKAVRELARQILVGRGYTVLEAAGGESALQLVRRHPDPIHLLLTDVVMPGLSGPELVERLAMLRPKTKVLYMSGYAEEALRRSGAASSDVRLLPKPFTMAALAGAVRAALDCG